jgi:tetratricopeptide (TPR) repeat protein
VQAQSGGYTLLSMEFRFTIPRLPDGMVMTVDAIEAWLLQDLQETQGASKQVLWDLAVFYSQTGRQEQAADYVSRLNALADNDDERAVCGLSMGQLQEQLGDFEAAVRYYSAALDLKSQSTDTSYWLHNNIGYSLIQLERPQAAIGYLASAVTIDSDRPNAHKNLGLAHNLLGEHAIAAVCFVSATQANASDARSLRHLEELVAAHPEVLAAVPDLRDQLVACRSAVDHVASMQPDAEAHWKKLRDRAGTPN